MNEEKLKLYKVSMRLEPKKIKKLLKFIAYPFVWLFYNLRDWRTFLIFAICFIVLSCEVWIPYLIGFIFWNNETIRISMFSVGSACLFFWNVIPFTPFIPIVISATIVVKSLLNKIKGRKKDEQKTKDRASNR